MSGSKRVTIKDLLEEIKHLKAKGRRQKKKTVKRVTSYIFQITPSLLTLRMTSERMTNHNNQWVPPSLKKARHINVLREVLEG